MTHKPIPEVFNVQGERIDHAFSPGREGCRELAIIGHGVTANMDRPFLVALSQALTKIGIPSLRISFSGNGNSGGRFEDSTISKEVADLGAVIDAMDGWRRITYVGHSMGAAVGVLRAIDDSRIKRLVSLAGMVHTREFVQRKFGGLTPGQDLMWDKPECPLSPAFVADLRNIDTVLPRTADVSVPWLLIHGTADEVVLPRDSLDAHSVAGGQPALVELPDVDHVFANEGTAAMTRVVSDWLRETIEHS